jgi:hypothetical protein
MEGSKTLFCSSKFPWASKRISSKLRTAFSRVITQRVVTIPSKFIENLDTPLQNVCQLWSSHVWDGVAFREMGCEGCLPSNAYVVAWSCTLTSVYVLILWWLPGHRNDFAGSGWGPAIISLKAWAINCQEKRGALISVFLEVRCLSETSFTPSMLCCQISPLPSPVADWY